ncbi:DNA polymerase III subunit gamma/tau [Candidatus Berkelbacteria bacterium]|nr:DNA polymerase III subunit gamma/tau [Candidatus Berkelbacteria bacterium]
MPALYRKYRPQRFEDVVGQDAAIEVLSKAVSSGKVAHGYLFAGPRGSGKTTTARLLAKAVNCPAEDNPCNACQICRDVIAGRDFDVIEIDAASHRGIEEIREIRDKVRFAPNRAKFKVYIIDEVHMLTKEAFNALLKTLEEPPEHVIFILATTEPHKVPATIISRVQRFDFKRATIEQIKQVLRAVAKPEKIILEDDAAEQIAYFADGSFRDALALLDQVTAGGPGKVTKSDVLRIFGVSSAESIDTFTDALLAKNPTRAITVVNELYAQGVDLSAFLNLAIAKLRQMMLWQGALELAQTVERLIEAGANIKYSPIPQIPIELAIVKITGVPAPTSKETDTKPNEPIINSTTFSWDALIEALKSHNHSIAALLSSCVGEAIGDEIKIYVKFAFHREKMVDPVNRAIIEKVALQTFGKGYTLVCTIDPARVESHQRELDQEIIDTALEVFEGA